MSNADGGDIASELPDAVRLRLASAAAALLGTLPSSEIPSSLRRIAKFAPARRAKVGAAMIMDALETDPVLRHRVAEAAAAASPDVAGQVRRGEIDADADPVDVGALAYLLRADGWVAVVHHATKDLVRRSVEQDALRRSVSEERLTDQFAALRASSREELAAVRADLDAARAEITRLRLGLGTAREEARVAARALEVAEARHRAALIDAASTAEAEVRRLRSRLADAEHALEASRRVARDGRMTESVRSRLLVDTLVEAAQGLRRELALPPVHTRPADLVTGSDPGVVPRAGSRGRDTDDPMLLEELLALPQVHLVVDGYNVTKTGYGELPLEDQRRRLVTALGSLAARTQAEITCVFDGADLDGSGAVQSVRRVRVRFSPPGVIADDVIRELVNAEPQGRPVVVVTNDAEVLRDVSRVGAWTAGSLALLRMLGAR